MGTFCLNKDTLAKRKVLKSVNRNILLVNLLKVEMKEMIPIQREH